MIFTAMRPDSGFGTMTYNIIFRLI